MNVMRLVSLRRILVAGLAPVVAASAQVRFFGIGDLPGGAVYSEVRDATKVGGVIHAVGSSAAGATTSGDTAIVWSSASGLVALPHLVSVSGAGPFITASAITPDARFIAARARAATTGNTRRAVRVTTSNLSLVDLGALAGFQVSAATAISNDGSTLWGFAVYNSAGASRAVRYNAADRTITPLPFVIPNHDTSIPAARGTSADGSVVVGESSNFATNPGGGVVGARAFRYAAGSPITEIPLLPGGTWNSALAVSPNGSLTLVRGNSTSSPQGELYLHNAASGAITRLDSPNGAYGPTNAAGMTADGSIAVINFNESQSATTGYLRNRSGWHELQTIATQAGANLAGWRLETPVGISPDGTLVWGSGIHNGNREGWVMEFPAGYLASYTEPATYSTPGRDIVGAWTLAGSTAESTTVLVFLANGYYFHIQDATAEEVANGGADGFERGQYTWNPSTGALVTRTLLDHNGDIGLSPGGAFGTVTIAGDTMTARASDGTYTLTRVTGSSPIVGAFGNANVHDGSSVAVFLPNGQYFHAQDGNADAATGGDPSGRDGIERGTYQWNPSTGVLTVNVALDTNGQWGLSHATQPQVVQPSAEGARVKEGTQPEGFVPRVRAVTLTLPTIVAQPESLTVTAGQRAGFTLTAGGTAPFSYQWRKDGAVIPGATAANFGLAATRAEDAGAYTCVVTNSVGSVTTAPAVLTVNRNFAGSYFGEIGNGRGHWGMIVLPDGTGTMIAYINNPRSGIVASVRIDPRGAFRVTSVLLQAGQSPGWLDGRPVAAATVPVTVAGEIGTTGVTGTFEGPNLTFAGTPDAPAGETAAISGLYQASGGGGNTTYAVVGSNRSVAALTVGATFVSGGLGTVGTNGAFSVQTLDRLTISGTVATTGTLTGTVAAEGTAAVTIAGTAVDAVGPPVIATPPRAQAAVAGAPVTLTVDARGAPLVYQWRKDGRDIAGATGATYTIAAALTADAAEYTCVITNGVGSVTTPGAALAVAPYNAGRLVNLSILTDLTEAGESFRLGTVVGGAGTSGAKPLLVRAAGPSLVPLGVANALADPLLESYFGANLTGENDNWGGGTALTQVFGQVGAFPFAAANSRDAAIFNPAVAPGNTSLRISGVAGATGRVIAELYEATLPSAYTLTTPRLVNVSVLKEVAGGFTLGFVIGGDSSPTVLIRAVGPGLANVGLSAGVLRDPKLTLFSGTAAIEENDNWGGSEVLAAAMARVGAFAIPGNSLDAAVLATLPPGSYTVQINGLGGGTGLVIAEVYELR